MRKAPGVIIVKSSALFTVAGAVFAATAALVPVQAGAEPYAQVITNNMGLCAANKGPAVRLHITGLRSSKGNVFIRTYHARRDDWLKGKRYLTRLDLRPQAGAVTACIPLPATGSYAIAVQHDENGNREMDFSADGAAMSNNPEIGSFLGIPRPPAVGKAAFNAGPGVTSLSVTMRYRD
jgi:uncharacterized protein (DUF2141 family)